MLLLQSKELPLATERVPQQEAALLEGPWQLVLLALLREEAWLLVLREELPG